MRVSIGLPGILFVVFLVLKLVGSIAWSWWWVTAPLWIPFVLTVVILIASVVLGALVERKKTPEQRAAEALRNYGKSLK